MFTDPFLLQLDTPRRKGIDGWLTENHLAGASFQQVLDNWFGNFDAPQKDLVLKVLLNLDYYSPEKFENVLEQRGRRIERILQARTKYHLSDVLLVTPEGQADSSHRHAYDLCKAWGISREDSLPIDRIGGRQDKHRPIVLFNDTYGTGNQFTQDMLPHLAHFARDKRSELFIAAIAIARDAFELFQMELPTAHLIPDHPAVSASPFSPQRNSSN